MKTRKALKKLRQIRKGRPLKEGVPRDKNGRIAYGYDRENPDEATKTAREARRRHLGVPAKKADNPLLGSPLGRLELAGRENGISEEQRKIGEQFEWLYRQMVRVREGLPPDPPSPASMMLEIALHRDPPPKDAEQPTGRNYDADTDEYAIHIKQRYAQAYYALARHQLEYGKPSPFEMLRAVVIEHKMPKTSQELGNLRIACNILTRLWRE